MVLFSFLFLNLIIALRFFYWQIIEGEAFADAATRQRVKSLEVEAERGKIFTSDNFCLVGNEKVYSLDVYFPDFKNSPEETAEKLKEILLPSFLETEKEASSSGINEKEEEAYLRKQLTDILINKDVSKWTILRKKISEEEKKKIEGLKISGLGFEAGEIRNYPEASMAAHLLGFVGKDKDGKSKGYFGIEGFYDVSLQGKSGLVIEEKDALGKTIPFGRKVREKSLEGRGLALYLDRAIQFVLEEELAKGIDKYGAKSGVAVVLDPKTGGVLGMAAWPNYSPEKYFKEKSEVFPNPIVAESFEPGSIFKPLILSAALEEKVVDENTVCDKCGGPRTIGEYTIRTWNNQYYPNSKIDEIIKHSDNTGMVFVIEKLGLEKTLEYLAKFGFGKKTAIDLQEEMTPSLKERWSPIDLATAGFGQGIAITPIQMLTAFSAIANKGVMMKPMVVKTIVDGEKLINLKPKVIAKPLSILTVELMTKILVEAVDEGEAKWAKPKDIKIAGKTGTAQIPISGHYDAEKTIASFIGFAPADDPKFVMLVSLREPQTSPWGSETAAPLWFKIAKRILLSMEASKN